MNLKAARPVKALIRLHCLLVSSLMVAVATMASAQQAYPTKPIRALNSRRSRSLYEGHEFLYRLVKLYAGGR